MRSRRTDAEAEVAGNWTLIPARIRRALDVEDGDRLRWALEGDDELRVEVVHRERGTFADFEGYDGDAATDAATERDEWGVEPTTDS